MRWHWLSGCALAPTHTHTLLLPLFANCGLQIRHALDASPLDKGVYETAKWDPTKPFVSDKVCVVVECSEMQPSMRS